MVTVLQITLLSISLVVNSALLFWGELMFTKAILPYLGGSALTWNTAMLVYQLLLLAGYFTVFVLDRLGVRGVVPTLACLVGYLVLNFPVVIFPSQEQTLLVAHHPLAGQILAMLSNQGLSLFFCCYLSSLIPWWMTDILSKGSKARAYLCLGLSCVGNVLGLAIYLTLVEPRTGLSQQASLWSWILGCNAVAALLVRVIGIGREIRPATVRQSGCSQLACAEGTEHSSDSDAQLAFNSQLSWVLVAAFGTSLYLSLTHYLATDVASFPLMWALPLTCFMLTMSAAFFFWRRLEGRYLSGLTFIFALLGLRLLHATSMSHGVIGILLHTLISFELLLFVQVTLASLQPASVHLTRYYFCLGLGGLLGSAANALLFPLISLYSREYEYSLHILLIWAIFGVVPQLASPKSRVVSGSIIAAVYVVMSCVLGDGRGNSPYLEVARSYYGSYFVQEAPEADQTIRFLRSGTTLHGFQSLKTPSLPTSYFGFSSPLAEVLSLVGEGERKIAIVGMGAGVISAYGSSGDDITYFEIDPLVERLAHQWFSYLDDAEQRGVQLRTEIGDGRLLLQKEPDKTYDLIVLDAFSSDSIPTHLLTKEAMSEFMKKLKSDAFLLYHVSNRYLDLAPVLGRSADILNLDVCLKITPKKELKDQVMEKASIWVLVADKGSIPEDFCSSPEKAFARNAKTWTDDYSNILSALSKLF